MNRVARRAAGLCWSCHEPAVSGRARCVKHLAASTKATERFLATERGKEVREQLKPYHATWRRNNRRGDGRFKYVVSHVARRGLEWGLTETEYEDLWTAPCHYCGLMNDVEAGVGLDRLDNSRGYVIGNVVSCCYLCNVTRADRFSPEEMKVLGKAIRAIRTARVPIL